MERLLYLGRGGVLVWLTSFFVLDEVWVLAVYGMPLDSSRMTLHGRFFGVFGRIRFLDAYIRFCTACHLQQSRC
jgi:hypothetical protein